MATQLHLQTPSSQTLLLTRLGILLVVMITGLLSTMLLRSQLEHYEIPPEQIPLANLQTWEALGR